MGELNGASSKEKLSPQQLKGKAISETKPFQPRALPSFKSILRPSASTARQGADARPATRLVSPASPTRRARPVRNEGLEEGAKDRSRRTDIGTLPKTDRETHEALLEKFGKRIIPPLAPPGKFSDSAADFASGDTALDDAAPSSTPLVHRKPKFAQIIKSKDRSSREIPNQRSLKALVDGEYNSSESAAEAETEDEQIGSIDSKIPGLECLLLPHQVRGVKFMSGRENSKTYTRGGLLGDEMGLGKTVQSIALILNRGAAKNAGIKTTLIVVPLTVMSQWQSEINQMAPSLKVGLHQGPKRVKDIKELQAFDAVITTYDTVSSEFSRGGALYGGPWYRIIADEAHTFRNPETQLAQGMISLASDGRRWALTGTPIHNSIVDLCTLFAFIGVSKYNLKELKKLHSTANQDSKLMAETRELLNVLMIRRTQRVLAKLLPPIEHEKRPVHLTPAELEVYHSYVPVKGQDNTQVMAKIIRMRQACNGLIDQTFSVRIGQKDPLQSGPSSSTAGSNSRLPSSSSTSISSAGSAPPAEKTGEVFEDDLLARMLDKLTLDREKSGEARTDKFRFHDISKVQAVREVLTEQRMRKTVLFSSFVTMLHALTPMLDYEGIRYEIYHGGLKPERRQAMLARFKDENEGVTVLLCSLQAAAVGLNLTAASQVLFVEPWWNPQIVDQATKRVHRLGQREKVRCIELYAANVLDERMLAIQDKKRKLARNLVDGSETLDQADRDFLYYSDKKPEGERQSEELAAQVAAKPEREHDAELKDRKMKDLPKMRKHIIF